MQWFQELTQALLRFYASHELPALFGFLFIEEAGIPLPLPGDTLLAFSGARHHGSWLFGLLVIAIATIAVFGGSSVLYFVMRRGGRPALEKYGKWLHVTPQRLERAERWFHQRGVLAIVVGRLIPGLRIPTTVMAGIVGVPYRTFLGATFFAAVLWSTIYYALGVALEGSLRRVVTFITGTLDSTTDWITFLAIVAAIALSTAAFWRGRQETRRANIPDRALRDQHPPMVATPERRPHRRHRAARAGSKGAASASSNPDSR